MATHPRDEVVTARVIFEGVMLGCINTDGPHRRYETGMIKCPRHSPKIWIGSNVDKEKEFIWPTGHDLIFKVVNPKVEGIQLHQPSPDTTQSSFNLVVDVEGSDFHEAGVTVNTRLFDGRRIGTTAGLLYADRLTNPLDLNTWTDERDPGTFVKHFGKIANHVGLNIVCNEGEENGIAIVDATTGVTPHWMPAISGVSHRIEVDNDCNRVLNPPPPDPGLIPTGASDFRFNYQVISPRDPSDKRKFDFTSTVASGRPRPSPDVCNVTGAGGTPSIGFDWSNL